VTGGKTVRRVEARQHRSFSLDNALNYNRRRRVSLGVLYLALLRLVRSPFGHGWWQSARTSCAYLPGLSGRALQARRLRHLRGGDGIRRRGVRIPDYLVSAEASRAFSGELARDRRDRRMPACWGGVGGCSSSCSGNVSIWTSDWCCGSADFVAFVLFSPDGLSALGASANAVAGAEETAAMSRADL